MFIPAAQYIESALDELKSRADDVEKSKPVIFKELHVARAMPDTGDDSKIAEPAFLNGYILGLIVAMTLFEMGISYEEFMK